MPSSAHIAEEQAEKKTEGSSWTEEARTAAAEPKAKPKPLTSHSRNAGDLVAANTSRNGPPFGANVYKILRTVLGDDKMHLVAPWGPTIAAPPPALEEGGEKRTNPSTDPE